MPHLFMFLRNLIHRLLNQCSDNQQESFVFKVRDFIMKMTTNDVQLSIGINTLNQIAANWSSLENQLISWLFNSLFHNTVNTSLPHTLKVNGKEYKWKANFKDKKTKLIICLLLTIHWKCPILLFTWYFQKLGWIKIYHFFVIQRLP